MKTIGLLGGMSWESSLSYYKIINQYTNKLLGEQNNAKSILYTVNFQEIEIGGSSYCSKQNKDMVLMY
jgi:aspartate racemase